MVWRLFLLFTLLPIIELALLIQVGKQIGTGPTIGIVIGTGLAGALLMRSQGLGLLRRIRNDLKEGRLPGETLVNALLVLIAEVLLVAPGVITDAVGILLLWPPTRRLAYLWAVRRFQKFLARR